MGDSCPKKPKLLNFFSKSIQEQILERVVVSFCRLLGVRPFVLKVRSWSGNDVSVNLYQINDILCSDKRGQSLKAQFSPWTVPVLVKGKQIWVSSSFRAKFPHSLQVSFLTEPGTQPSRSSVSSGCPDRETSSHKLRPRKMATATSLQRQGWGRGSLLLKA